MQRWIAARLACQVALNAQKELDAADLEALEERLKGAATEKKKRK